MKHRIQFVRAFIQFRLALDVLVIPRLCFPVFAIEIDMISLSFHLTDVKIGLMHAENFRLKSFAVQAFRMENNEKKTQRKVQKRVTIENHRRSRKLSVLSLEATRRNAFLRC